MSNIVAIVGRPNVGKSTLFNRLIEERKAIVDETSGVTRDRQYGHSDWNGKKFSVIDTGGYVMGGDDEFEVEIRKQVQLAIEEADVILFLVDAKEGLTPMDEDVAKMLRRCNKKVILVVNKVDTPQRLTEISDFYALGLGELFPIAGITGSGTGELLDAVVADFDDGEDDTTSDLPRITVVGRPNVGKSSFINTITGQERNIVTPIAGTRRADLFTKITFSIYYAWITAASLIMIFAAGKTLTGRAPITPIVPRASITPAAAAETAPGVLDQFTGIVLISGTPEIVSYVTVLEYICAVAALILLTVIAILHTRKYKDPAYLAVILWALMGILIRQATSITPPILFDIICAIAIFIAAYLMIDIFTTKMKGERK